MQQQLLSNAAGWALLAKEFLLLRTMFHLSIAVRLGARHSYTNSKAVFQGVKGSNGYDARHCLAGGVRRPGASAIHAEPAGIYRTTCGCLSLALGPEYLCDWSAWPAAAENGGRAFVFIHLALLHYS